jgi:Holliday junction DNA helicase RuvA
MLSTQSLASLNEIGRDVTVLTTLITREDSMTLYGFMSEQEQRLFERLITVSGIGPKVALSALSAYNAETLQQVIIDEDVARVSMVPGIGKKTAQRIILELRGTLDAREPSSPQAKASSAMAQAKEALLGMGFTTTEASLALQGYDHESGADDVGALVRFGLKRLGNS